MSIALTLSFIRHPLVSVPFSEPLKKKSRCGVLGLAGVGMARRSPSSAFGMRKSSSMMFESSDSFDGQTTPEAAIWRRAATTSWT